jgi:hypothetical protein
LLEVTLSPARDRDQLRSGPRRVGWCQAEFFAAVDRGRVIGWDRDTSTPYSGYRFPTEIISYAGWMSGVVIALEFRQLRGPRHQAGSSSNGKVIGNQIEHKLFEFSLAISIVISLKL